LRARYVWLPILPDFISADDIDLAFHEVKDRFRGLIRLFCRSTPAYDPASYISDHDTTSLSPKSLSRSGRPARAAAAAAGATGRGRLTLTPSG